MQSSRSRCTQKASERATIRKSGIPPRGDCRADAPSRLFRGAQRLRGGGVLACAGVVLDVDRRNAAIFEGSHRGGGIFEARFGIGDDRYTHRGGDRSGLSDYCFHRQKPRICDSEAARGGGVTSDVNAFVAMRLDQTRA